MKHKSAVLQQQQSHTRAEAAIRRYEVLHSSTSIPLQTPVIDPPITLGPQLFAFGYDINGINLDHPPEMTLDELNTYFPADEDSAVVQQSREEMLRQEAEALIFTDFEQEFEGVEEDMSIPQIVNDLRAAGNIA